jgi:Domain of unknown function (DUF4381)
MSGRKSAVRDALSVAVLAVCLAAAAVTNGHCAPAPAAPTAEPLQVPASAAASNQPQEDIRDIRGPKYVHPEWFLPALLAGIALLALIIWGVWRWRRRRHDPRILLPFEVALQRLEEIRPLMIPASAPAFGIAVSDIVRTYIEQRFAVTVTQRTTEEFLQDLLGSANEALVQHQLLLADFLQQCDIVKFANLSIASQSMESLRQSARTFVQRTAEPDAAADKVAHDSLSPA